MEPDLSVIMSSEASGISDDNGSTEIPGESLRPEACAWHLLGLLIPISAILGNIAGDVWVVSTTVLALGIYPLLDVVSGEAKPARPPRDSGTPFEAILHFHSILHVVVVATLLWRASLDGNAWPTWAAAFSTGIASGISGIIVAHELGHRKPKSISWRMGRANLVLCLYTHFTTEHNHHHHRTVATTSDPASAPPGRGLWAHVAQTIPRQFASAWRIERERARKRGVSDSFVMNPVLHGVIVQAVVVAAILTWGGVWPVLAFVGQAALSIFLLEYVNYIRHYGLQRAADERQTEMHSWQTEVRWSRWTLLELTRHPAHHLKASEPYWRLQPYSDAPTLPSGYFGCFWPCLVPPLWRRWVDSRIPDRMDSPA